MASQNCLRNRVNIFEAFFLCHKREVVDMTQKYYSAGETAQIIGVGWDTVVRWAKTGKIPARKYGGRWRIPRKAVDPAVLEPHIYNSGIKSEKPSTENRRLSTLYTKFCATRCIIKDKKPL